MLIDGQRECADLAHDRGLAYGDGVFETLAVLEGRILYWDAHMARLQRGCTALGFTAPSTDLLARECGTLAQDCAQGVLKIIVTRGSGGRGYRPPDDARPRRIVTLHRWPDGLDAHDAAGVRTWICAHRLGANAGTAGLKHLNRLDQVLAAREWPPGDFFEGLMMDAEGCLVEGIRSNLYVVRGDVLRTPDLARCGVAGVVRDAMLAACRDHGIEARIETVMPEELGEADEIFISNSIIGLRAVVHVRGSADVALRAGPLCALLRHTLRAQGVIP